MSALTEKLVAVRQAARLAGHGGKGDIYAEACKELGCSLATLHRKLNETSVAAPRKQRSDEGKTALALAEAELIAALMQETTRRNGKQLYSLEEAVKVLRENKQIKAEKISPDGVVSPLSMTTIFRALRHYGLHRDQLNAPAPYTELATEYPNQCWQIDASICTMYYLSNGLKGMPAEVYNKNKPANMERIAAHRVWRYVITDHYSGWLYVEYVLGAESGENLCTVLINAMQERSRLDMLHGRPEMLMMDPGSANTAAMTLNLCNSLGIKVLINKVHNARAKGSVEKAHDITERSFEPGLKLVSVSSLAQLNALVTEWRIDFNNRRIHRRHGKTRSAIWMTIPQNILVKVPSVDVCRELAVAKTKDCKVKPNLVVSFLGKEYKVKTVPGVAVGEMLAMTRNPWRDDSAQVALKDADGNTIYHVVYPVKRNDVGFDEDAAIIGQNYKSFADTPVQKNAKRLEKIITRQTNEDDVKKFRKAKLLPFGGEIKPYAHIDNDSLPTPLPRKGIDLVLSAPKIEFQKLNIVEAAKILRAALGDQWTPETYGWLSQRYADGVDSEEIDSIISELSGTSAALKMPLKLVSIR
jgi:transposase InsO family protein